MSTTNNRYIILIGHILLVWTLFNCIQTNDAKTVYWNSTVSCSSDLKCQFGDTANWIGNVLPSTTDDAVIDLASNIEESVITLSADVTFNSLTAVGPRNDSNTQGDMAKLTFTVINSTFNVSESRFTNAFVNVTESKVPGNIFASNNTYCIIYYSNVSTVYFTGNTKVTLWRVNLANFTSVGSPTSMIPSSPFDQVNIMIDDVIIDQSTVNNPASALYIWVTPFTVVNLHKSTFKGYSCQFVISSTTRIYEYLDLGANGQLLFDTINGGSPGRLQPFNAKITAATVQIGNGWLDSGNIMINGDVTSNSSSRLTFKQPNQFDAPVIINGTTSILNSAMLVNFKTMTTLPNVQYLLMSSINNDITYQANRAKDQVTYNMTDNNSEYKIVADGKQLYIQFGKSCANATDCNGHAICNDGMCQCVDYYQDPGCSVPSCMKNCSGRGECIFSSRLSLVYFKQQMSTSLYDMQSYSNHEHHYYSYYYYTHNIYCCYINYYHYHYYLYYWRPSKQSHFNNSTSLSCSCSCIDGCH
ncbi:hypothetical protein SAMD00019534_029850 [Acytostelium subglobosum LB1]|uniref:hypothetical protein n=1 Tax=Acytostelium subglobosum LB1 TaxID=1410327 RepID=UPI000644A2A6|nr:hypothetical protein SAMD00019534_029850 [Acytostelium subglobosum LB1]GAM19810.1 hypothetical protein SAMD00019534_029850 [Acytostelium subglobosum LB1]|eukprot:XP_012756572.1 hypothetical protein SAMD00019534_029850 [Acytostelium subglobosum LB1]